MDNFIISPEINEQTDQYGIEIILLSAFICFEKKVFIHRHSKQNCRTKYTVSTNQHDTIDEYHTEAFMIEHPKSKAYKRYMKLVENIIQTEMLAGTIGF